MPDTKIDYALDVTTLQGEAQTLEPYRGEVMLIVNTASKCGLTPQYEGLEALHRAYQERGLRLLGFPCNQFGAQEPGGADEIAQFCQTHYEVTFPMFAKLEVNGPGTHPLYRALKRAAKGLLGTEKIKWNFTKFLIARDGTILKRYAPTTKPEALKAEIERELKRGA